MILFLFFIQSCFAADDAAQVNPVDFETTVRAMRPITSELLSEDPIAPATTVHPIQQNLGDDLVRNLDELSSLPSQDYGWPGGGISLGVSGLSIDDVSTTTLGVPLNLPQGGGPDFSQFPSFLFNSATLSDSVTATGNSPQGIVGTLDLHLWTMDHLRAKDQNNQSETSVFSSWNRTETDFGASSSTKNAAILAGGSIGSREGAAGSISANLSRWQSGEAQFHFIGTNFDSATPGSISFPTPDAEKKSTRIIPVLTIAQDLADDWQILGTFYGDISTLDYEDPNNSEYDTNTKTTQYGTELAMKYQNWVWSGSVRRVSFESSTFAGTEEVPLFSSLSTTLKNNSWIFSPEAQVSTIAGQVKAEPGAKFGARKEFSESEAWFQRVEFLPKLPTIDQRYYVFPGFVGNPNLRPEQMLKFSEGWDYTPFQGFSSRLEPSVQRRYAIQIIPDNTPVNAGGAWVIAADHTLQFEQKENFRVVLTSSWNIGWLDYNKQMVPNLPRWATKATFSKDFFLPQRISPFAGWQMATLSPGAGGNNQTYALFDAGVSGEIMRGVQARFGVENIFNRTAQVIYDYPLEGRIFHLGVEVTL